ncbi:MAG TPA: HAD-IA family hydrolase, partial [Steroidobacteraceae bacterium]|nr:HAD-IA family hydrolase [Steroidobacteraceae bacterium]
MDGVVTRTAELHATAWKAVFDEVLREWAAKHAAPFRAFDSGSDYLSYVDGRPRDAGVRNFLASRGIELPEGAPDDDPSRSTVHGIAKRKDALFGQALRRDGARVYESTLALVRALRGRGVRTGIVTSSRHGREVMRIARIEALFDARVDGNDLDARGLKGKPDPDAFLECARALDVPPARSALIEDATVGVEAGRRGGFGLVVGVDRGGNREALAAHGADVVVADLGELNVVELEERLRERQRRLAWRIEQEGFDPAREEAMESLFAIGNGYLGVRGALDTPFPGALDDLFVAGVYDCKQPHLPYSEPEFLTQAGNKYEELVPLPFPFRICLTVGGAPLGLQTDHWLSHRRILELDRATLESELRFEIEGSRTLVRTRRLASLDDLHLLLQEISVELENHAATVELDGRLASSHLSDRYPHLEPIATDKAGAGIEVLHFRTKASRYEVAIAARTALIDSGTDALCWRVPAGIGARLIFRRMVAVYTSRDVETPLDAALAHLRALEWNRFDGLAAAHAERWQEVWTHADVRVVDQPAVEQGLRFNIYHLRSAADHDARVSIGARTLSGRGYQGHVFWDVEIFMLPFFLYTCPQLARHLLLYRYETLDGARERARGMGFRGACYAWESTVTGEDVTPRMIRLKTTGKEIPIHTGTQQIHITADVAYAIWRYWEATGDEDFLREAGVEILVETARFWVSRCTRENAAYHIHGVVGPDEYHYGVSDNAYTNRLARFNLEKAATAIEWLRQTSPQRWDELRAHLAIAPQETEEWARVARELYWPGARDDGVIEQFAGFFALDTYSLPDEERMRPPVSRLFDAERINQLQLLKQADVLMLPYLFPGEFAREIVLANYRYYEPRTDHGSSLSPAIHAAIAAQLGLRADAERYFRQSLWLDLSNEMGNSAAGVHAACMGGTWQALV